MKNWKYLDTKQVVDDPRYPLKMGQLRCLLTKRHQNGLSKAIRRIGKRLYFREDLWEAWIESHQEEKKAK